MNGYVSGPLTIPTMDDILHPPVSGSPPLFLLDLWPNLRVDTHDFNPIVLSNTVDTNNCFIF